MVTAVAPVVPAVRVVRAASCPAMVVPGAAVVPAELLRLALQVATVELVASAVTQAQMVTAASVAWAVVALTVWMGLMAGLGSQVHREPRVARVVSEVQAVPAAVFRAMAELVVRVASVVEVAPVVMVVLGSMPPTRAKPAAWAEMEVAVRAAEAAALVARQVKRR